MTSTAIDFSKIKKAYSYYDYFSLVNYLVQTNATTGVAQTADRIEATKLNAQRMKRISKQFILSEGIKNILKNLNHHWKWFVLAEAWCGDGAQCIPALAKFAAETENIELKIILRDENPEIMDAYLTNGGRAIPKLICLDADMGEEVGIWGARPAEIQQMVRDFKAQNPDVSHEEFVRNLHFWYAKDKGESLQKEFEELLTKWNDYANR